MWSRRAAAVAVAGAVLCGLAACSERAEAPAAEVAPASRIVELEGQFAAASRVRGAKAAFLEFLAEDSIVLQPGPVWGRAAWENAEERADTLDWKPDRAQLSADGRWGYSTGPWTLTRAEGGATLTGRYLTVWRESGHGWRVVFDGGFTGAAADGAAPATPARLDAAGCARDSAAKDSDLQQLDIGLAGTADAGSYADRLRDRAAPGLALFHPPNVAGAEGTAALEIAFAALSPTTQLLPMGAGLAGSGDLGYTYGLSAPAAEAAADAAYVHIWCRGPDHWRLLVELRAPLPPPAG